MSYLRIDDTRKLIEFLHVDGKDPTKEVQLIHNKSILTTNLDALLNYGNWRSGKVWANFQTNAQEAVYEVIVEQRYRLPDEHKFISHVFTADPEALSITVTTSAKAPNDWIYDNVTTKFYSKAAYLHLVGLMHGVRHTHPVPNRLMDRCKLTIVPQYKDVMLDFPDDPKSEQLYIRSELDGVKEWTEVDTALVATNDEVRGEK